MSIERQVQCRVSTLITVMNRSYFLENSTSYMYSAERGILNPVDVSSFSEFVNTNVK